MNYHKRFIGLGFLCLTGLLNSCNMTESNKETTLFVGTYTGSGSEGIYKFNFNTTTGELTGKTLAAAIDNPSFLSISPDRKTLYAVGEVDDFIPNSGAIITYHIKDSILEKVDSKPTYGENPCYVGVSEDGSYVAVANYTGGNVAIYQTKENGDLNGEPQIIDHKVLDTSLTAHAHKASFLNNELFVADLGLDRLKKYSLKDQSFTPSQQPELVLAEGAGPRHFTFSANEEFLYVINELNSTLTLFQKEDDKYFVQQTLKTTAPDFKGESFCADIHLSPDGKFLYGSNRGENTIVVFKVDGVTGKLETLGRESVKGDWPRNFSLDPTGNYLLVANQRSNNIVVFKRDVEEGTLTFLSRVDLPNPVCLEFY